MSERWVTYDMVKLLEIFLKQVMFTMSKRAENNQQGQKTISDI